MTYIRSLCNDVIGCFSMRWLVVWPHWHCMGSLKGKWCTSLAFKWTHVVPVGSNHWHYTAALQIHCCTVWSMNAQPSSLYGFVLWLCQASKTLTSLWCRIILKNLFFINVHTCSWADCPKQVYTQKCIQAWITWTKITKLHYNSTMGLTFNR